MAASMVACWVSRLGMEDVEAAMEASVAAARGSVGLAPLGAPLEEVEEVVGWMAFSVREAMAFLAFLVPNSRPRVWRWAKFCNGVERACQRCFFCVWEGERG